MSERVTRIADCLDPLFLLPKESRQSVSSFCDQALESTRIVRLGEEIKDRPVDYVLEARVGLVRERLRDQRSHPTSVFLRHSHLLWVQIPMKSFSNGCQLQNKGVDGGVPLVRQGVLSNRNGRAYLLVDVKEGSQDVKARGIQRQQYVPGRIFVIGGRAHARVRDTHPRFAAPYLQRGQRHG